MSKHQPSEQEIEHFLAYGGGHCDCGTGLWRDGDALVCPKCDASYTVGPGFELEKV